MVLVPIVSYLVGGWMIGWASTPYDPEWAARYPRKAALMSFAGPAANLLLSLLGGAFILIGVKAGFFDSPQTIYFGHVVESLHPGPLDTVAFFVSLLFSLNLLLFLFNLMPIPPLDGSGIYRLFSGATGERINGFLGNPLLSYGGIVAAWWLLDLLFPRFLDLAIHLLYPGVTYR